MGEMGGFGIAKTNPLDWAKNLIVSLDPYTKGIAERKLRTAYRGNSSPDNVLQFLRQLSSISISRTANRATNINSFGFIGKQNQEVEHKRYLARLRESQRAKFDEMMATPISLNSTSATYDDILKGREGQSQKEYEQLRDYYAGIELEQSEKKAKKAKIDELYRKDMLSDFDSRIEYLTERYGGDKIKAEDKYKKELSQNLPLFFRNSKMTAKQMHSIVKGLSVGRAIATPVGMAAGVAMQTINKIIGGADEANKRSVGIENLKNLYGGLSKNETNAALLAGMTPERALQAKGKLMMKYGPKPFEVLSGIASQVKDASPQARTALAEKLGIDESLFAMVDILGLTSRIDADSEHRQTQAQLENEKIRGMYLRRSGSGFLNTIKGMSSDSWAARGSEAIRISEESASTPTQTLVAPTEKSPSSGNQISFNIGTVDVNADNPEQLAYELGAVASSHSNNHTLAVAFDSGIKA